jgi:hypothetical protein
VRVLVQRQGRFLLVRQATARGPVWLPPGGTPELGSVVSPRGGATVLFAGRVAADAAPRAAGLPGEGLTAVAWLRPEETDAFTRSLLARWPRWISRG